MSYQIVITKIENQTVSKEGDWCIVEKRPWTEKELSEALSSHYGDRKSFLEKNPLKEVRGYAPNRDVTEAKQTEVLRQTVDELDLAAVIKAVNNL